MPLYEFKCEKCGKVVDKIMKSTDTLIVKCPVDSEVMIKQFTVPAFKFSNGHGTDLGNLMSIPGIPRTSI